MPLPKRVIEPVHVGRGTLPDDFPLPSELEAVTNGALANTVRQLSSLSRHAEDMFGELTRDTQQLYDRSNSLQARIDRLAIKVTQLDSTVEEVSLQDIHMRKAFKSAIIFDQQIFSRATMPTAMLETYNSCDKPPPLDKLNCYRDDGKDGLKFYTDPNYFFELWRQEMLNDTERMMHDRGKKPHRLRTSDGGQGNRHKKRVRQPHNTRERQKLIAMGHGEYIMPLDNATIYRSSQQLQQQLLTAPQQQQQIIENNNNGLNDPQMRPPRPNSIEIRRSYPQEQTDGLPSSPTNSYHHSIPATTTYEENPYQHGMYGQGPLSSESLYQGGTPTRGVGGKIRPSQPPPAPPSNSSTPSSNTPTRGRSMSTGRDNLPPPPPPPEGVSTMSPPPLAPNGIPTHLVRATSRSNSPSHQSTPEPQIQQDLPPPPPIPKQQSISPPKQQSPPPAIITAAPPPPPPPPPMPLILAAAATTNGPSVTTPSTNNNNNNNINSAMLVMNGDLAKILNSSSPPKLKPVKDRMMKQAPPMVDPRNDLLKAIRDGFKLRKVEKIEQKEVERGNGLHDVASILARRVAVEFSDSESGSDSECDSEGWGENETSA